MKKTVLYAAVLTFLASCAEDAPTPYGAVPSAAQVEWQKMETNMFVHFGPNTFSGREWGNGQESTDLFNPTSLDCRQWARTAKAAGFKGIIITAKHHDGFSLWPNPTSTHTVAQSAWRNGKGDVLRELSDACREYGLKFGIYLSPWDRNHPAYGTDAYNKVFTDALDSSLSQYGPVFEQWFDGACGEGPNGKRQVYDWEAFNEHVFANQPQAIIFSNIGPGCRWVGNEAGKAGETSWSTFTPELHGANRGALPGDFKTYLGEGDPDGACWIPSETDVSIRPGWFWREEETSRVRSLSNLLDLYYSSVGRNSLLLLNVPADTRGLIPAVDSTRLMEFRAALDTIFSVNLAAGAKAEASTTRGRKYAASQMLDTDYDTCWAAPDGVTEAVLTFHLDGVKRFNRVLLQEYIPLGQRVKSFEVEARDAAGNWNVIATATTIGYKRILLVDETQTDAVRIRITGSLACPLLNGFGLYLDRIMHSDEPTAADDRLCMADGFRVVAPQGAEAAVDGLWDESHSVILSADKTGRFPSVTVDLGREREFLGIAYTPAEGGRGGCMMEYRLEVGPDGESWTTVTDGAQVDNIVNNPTMRILRHKSMLNARWIRVSPLRSNLAETVSVGELSLVVK